MKKISRIKAGMIFTIPVFNDEVVFGRILRSDTFVVYKKKFQQIEVNKHEIKEADIIMFPLLFYTSVYDDAFKNGPFQYYGKFDILQKELDDVPPVFTQDILNKQKCKLYFFDGKIEDAVPSQCIGLNKFSVWEGEGVIARIENLFNGTENFYMENNKVKLE